MRELLRRMPVPKYHKYKDWNGLHIDVVPSGIRIKKWLLRILPLYVGDQPKFSIKIKRLRKSAPNIKDLCVWEKLPSSEEFSLLQTLVSQSQKDKAKIDIECANHPTEQGDLAYQLSLSNKESRGKPLLTATVFSRDKRNVNLLRIAASALFAIFGIIISQLTTGIAPDSPFGKLIYTPIPVSTATQEAIEEMPTATQEVIIEDKIPLISEDFANENLDRNIWNDYICHEINPRIWGENLRFTAAQDKDGNESRNCYLPLRIEKYTINEVSFEVTLHDAISARGFAGLFTSCGQDEFTFYVSRQDVSYRKEDQDRISVYEHLPNLPITYTLVIRWDMETQKILLELYDADGITRINTDPIEPISCADFPERIRFGVLAEEGYEIDAEFDEIKIYGSKK